MNGSPGIRVALHCVPLLGLLVFLVIIAFSFQVIDLFTLIKFNGLFK